MTCRIGDEKPPGQKGREQRVVGGGRQEQSKVPSTLACYRAGTRQRIGSFTGIDGLETDSDSSSRLAFVHRVSRLVVRNSWGQARPRPAPRHFAVGQRVAIRDGMGTRGL